MRWPGPAFTAVDSTPITHRIRYADPILMLGSCFAEHMAGKLSRYKYQVLENPFGILYNPASMAVCMQRIVHKRMYQADDLVMHAGLYHSMDHHGSFSGTNAAQVTEEINHLIDKAHTHLLHSSFVFVSPGTSLVYRYKTTGRIAGNCHKIPQKSFDQCRMTVEECHTAFEQLYTDVKSVSPGAQIIWTISPVRHLRDGLIENQKSKAVLIVALDQIIKQYPDTGYFPAYEIMMDQLRDYRYYARDLSHPSTEAVDIIWAIFRDTYLDDTEVKLHPAIEKIRRSMEHRFLHDDTQLKHAFAQDQLAQIEQLKKQLPLANWEREKEYFNHVLLS